MAPTRGCRRADPRAEPAPTGGRRDLGRGHPRQTLGGDPACGEVVGVLVGRSADRSSPRNASRTAVTRWKYCSSSRVSTFRSRGRSMSMMELIRPGPRRHHDDARRQEDGLGDRMRHEHDRRLGPFPDLEQLEVHPLAGHLVERAERLVHQQDRRVDRQCPGDRHSLLHAARELPRVVAGEVGQLDEPELLHGALRPLRLRALR